MSEQLGEIRGGKIRSGTPDLYQFREQPAKRAVDWKRYDWD